MTDLELDQQFARRRDAARRMTDAERSDARARQAVRLNCSGRQGGHPGDVVAAIGDTEPYLSIRAAAKSCGYSDSSIRRSAASDGQMTVAGRVWVRVTPALWKLWQAVGGPLSRELVREAQATGRAA